MPWVGGLLPQCRACAKGCFFLFLFFLLLLMSQITSARCGWPNGNCRSASPWTATLLLSGALDGETSKALGGFGFPSGIYQSVLRHHWWQLANTKVLGRTDQKFRCNFIQNPLNPLVALVFLYHQHLLIPSFFFFFFCVCVCVARAPSGANYLQHLCTRTSYHQVVLLRRHSERTCASTAAKAPLVPPDNSN